jgi:hypothetical protein
MQAIIGPGGRATRPRPGGNPQPQAEVNLPHKLDTRARCSTRKSSCRLGKPAGQPVTVKVAEAILPLWRPLVWKVSCRPGMVDPAKPLGTANEAAIWPPAVALAVVSTVAPKLTSTGSAGANPRQERVTRDPAGPVLGEMAQVALAGMTVVPVVVPVDPAVGWVVEAAVGLAVGAEEGLEEDAAAVWSAVLEVQPVMARAAMKTAVSMG